MDLSTLFFYLIFVNIISTMCFVYDKMAARNSLRRVNEHFLHLLEATGGVFMVLILMYLIHHKYRKPSYFLLSWIFFVFWVFVLAFIYTEH